jgi:phenylacetate-CoA ligase
MPAIARIIKARLRRLFPESLWNSLHQARHAALYKKVAEVYLQLSAMQQRSPEEIARIRESNLLALLQHAYATVPYYRRMFHEVGYQATSLDGFGKIRLLDKQIVRENFDLLLAQGFSPERSFKMNTGGSTGDPLEFYVSSYAGLVSGMHHKYQFGLMGYRAGDTVAGFGGLSIPDQLRAEQVYWITSTSQTGMPITNYSSLYLDDGNISYYVDNLLKTGPAILRGYPSFLNSIAQYLLVNGISVPFAVKGVVLTSENAFDWQLENIKAAFQCPVYLEYGHSECAVFAYSVDDSYRYLCSPFYGFVEVLDAQGNQVAPGENGEIVVTGFNNEVMPFIRYRTGDIARYGGVQDGLQSLEQIVGRTQDFVYRPDGQKTALTALVFGQHYKAFKHIKKWQIVQDRVGEVSINLVKDAGFTDSCAAEIEANFFQVAGIRVLINYVDQIALTRSGKFKFLVQNVQL